jgi:PGAP1-like protein
MGHDTRNAPISPCETDATRPARAWPNANRIKPHNSDTSAGTPPASAPTTTGPRATHSAVHTESPVRERASDRTWRRASALRSRAWRRRRLGRYTLLAIMIVGLFGMLGVMGVTLRVTVGNLKARHGWTRQATFSLMMAACALVLVGASLAPTNWPQPRQTSSAVETSPRLGTMASLFNNGSAIANTDPPVRIVTVGAKSANTIIVMLRAQASNHIGPAIKSAIGAPGDPTADLARRAIEHYRWAARLAPGTAVILAGHSFGGIIAQEVASDPRATDYKVAAVVTWGAPDIGGHVAGVTYQQYFSQYDVVPMLSTYRLGPLLLRVGLIGTVSALLAMQGWPYLKAMFTGQTYVPDMGQYANPWDWVHADGSWNDAHDGYGESEWLTRQTLTYMRDGERMTLTLSSTSGRTLYDAAPTEP